jgi:HPt (histidine-containing phosphotransfer) domain-containing protein
MDRVIRVIASTLKLKVTSVAAGTASQSTAMAQRPQPTASAPRQSSADRINSTLPIDDPVMCEIVGEFVDRLHQQVGAMKQAAAREDLAQVAFLAHWLKGSGGTAGFDAFTAPARHLEAVAKGREFDQISQAIEEIQSIVDRVQRPEPTSEKTQVKTESTFADEL